MSLLAGTAVASLQKPGTSAERAREEPATWLYQDYVAAPSQVAARPLMRSADRVAHAALKAAGLVGGELVQQDDAATRSIGRQGAVPGDSPTT